MFFQTTVRLCAICGLGLGPQWILQAGEVQSFSYILLCRCLFEVTIIVIFADGIGQYWDNSGQKYSFYMSYLHLLIDII